jgi:hypothetical protein
MADTITSKNIDFIPESPAIYMRQVPLAARSKAEVYGRSPTVIVVSNPTEGMDVCVVCCQVEVTATSSSLVQRSPTVVVCDQETSWYEEAIARAGLQSQRK